MTSWWGRLRYSWKLFKTTCSNYSYLLLQSKVTIFINSLLEVTSYESLSKITSYLPQSFLLSVCFKIESEVCLYYMFVNNYLTAWLWRHNFANGTLFLCQKLYCFTSDSVTWNSSRSALQYFLYVTTSVGSLCSVMRVDFDRRHYFHLQWSEVLTVETPVVQPGSCSPVCLISRAQATCLHVGWGNQLHCVSYDVCQAVCLHLVYIHIIGTDENR